MKALLRFEFRRLFRGRTFLVCFIVSTVLVILSVLVTVIAAVFFAEKGMIVINALTMLKSQDPFYSLIAAIFTAIFVTEDYSSDTIKNICSKGYKREQVFFSKYLSSLAGCMILLFTSMLIRFSLSGILSGIIGTPDDHYAASLLTMVLLYIAYHAFFFGVSISLRKTGGAIALAILGPSIVEVVLSIADLIVRSDRFSLVMYSIDGRLLALGNPNVPWSDVISGILIGIGAIAVSLVLSFVVNKKRDN